MSEQRTRDRQRQRQQTPPNGTKPSKDHLDSSTTEESPIGADSSDNSQNKPSTGGGSWRGVMAAIAIVAAIGVAYLGFGGGGVGDQVSDADIQAQETAYQSLLATPGLPLTYIAPEDVDKAIDEMPPSVTTEQRQQLRTEIKQGRTKLAWLTLWDTHAEDGDILRFQSSSSIPVEITALNSKTTIAIPYPADGEVLVTGVHDGGGGITIALESGATQIAWPTMQPGDTLKLPVTPGY